LIFQYFETQEESYEAMKDFAKSMITLAGQLDRLKQVSKSDQLDTTISEFLGMMGEVVDFIQEWLEN